MDPDFLISIAVVLILGSALQSAAGFAFGMFAIPLLILLGAKPYQAIAIISVCGTIQTIVGVYTLRGEIDYRQVGLMTLLASLFIPLGVWVLGFIADTMPVGVIRQIFGAVVLCAVLVQWLWHVQPRARLHWSWLLGAMPVSGFMTGLAGMGGPPAVIWVMAHTWSNQRSRATLWAFFTATTPVSWLALYARFGGDVFTSIGTGLALSPVMAAGILPGLWIGHRIPKPLLRQMSYILLLLVSLYAILQPLLVKLGP